MAVYKRVRKGWLKRLSKSQRKQFKEYVQDVADSMLECYSETIRLKGKAYHNESNWFPIDDTNVGIRVYIELDHR